MASPGGFMASHVTSAKEGKSTAVRYQYILHPINFMSSFPAIRLAAEAFHASDAANRTWRFVCAQNGLRISAHSIITVQCFRPAERMRPPERELDTDAMCQYMAQQDEYIDVLLLRLDRHTQHFGILSDPYQFI